MATLRTPTVAYRDVKSGKWHFERTSYIGTYETVVITTCNRLCHKDNQNYEHQPVASCKAQDICQKCVGAMTVE